MMRVAVGFLLIVLAVLAVLIGRQLASSMSALDIAPSDDAILVEQITPSPISTTVVPTPAPTLAAGATVSPAKRDAEKMTVTPTAAPTLAPTPEQTWVPTRLVIPSLNIDASVVDAKEITVKINGAFYRQWAAPNSESVGWLPTSATLGLPGNTSMISHDNGGGHVFANLVDIKIGAKVIVYSGAKAFNYVVTANAKLLEAGQPLSVRLQNASWAGPFPDERLTLITCWPYWGSTYRIVVIARPVR